MDYINAPVGGGRAPVNPLQAAGRRPHHHRHRRGEHHDLRAGRAGAEGEDRHQPRPAAPDAGRRRPAAHADPARRGHRRRRDGHPLPRAGELHRPAVHRLRAQAARGAGALLRRQPDRRHVVRAGAAPARRLLPRRRAPRRRRRGPRARWRWPRRSPGWASATRACTSRTPTPTRSPGGSGTSGRRLPGRRADGAARHVGRADRAGGVPVHLRRPPGAAPARGRSCSTRPRASRTTPRSSCPAC